ncbi:tetratricopeptide repeat protein [Undibacterium sp. TJN19]|uniref:tetratricopeptide repeat protein n=1 Tax=Undibacterium sp. TJN19 TaxID=3413055 RepID=UPI003BF2A7B3
MSISDPAQLFQRVPELLALSEDPKISRAIETGDPFKVYRALVLARLFRRLPEHKAVLKALTQERRLFAKPLKSTPSLGSINSIGFSFIGESEKDSDGSYIALHAFVILFAIPLVPLGSYVVRVSGPNQWQIFARAPLGILGWLYTRGLAMILVVLVLTGAAHSYHESNYQDLTLLNGFEVPLTVSFGNQVISVPAQGRTTITLEAGIQHGTARAIKAGVIDTLDTTLESSDRYSIWNIAGAAPLVRNTIVYTKESLPRADNVNNTGGQTVYCGKRFIELSNIKYAFTEPPQTMTMSKHENETRVEHITVISQPKTAGVFSCINYAFSRNQEKQMTMAMDALLPLKDWDPRYVDVALQIARSTSTAEAIRLSRRIVKENPGNIIMERNLQDIRDEAGEHELMLREYAERARQKPDASNEQYLYVSLFSGIDGLQRMAELAQKFPDNTNILRSLVWRKAAHGDVAGAYHDLTHLHQLSQQDANYLFEVEIRLLLAQQRHKEALKLLETTLSDKKTEHYSERALEFGLIARQLNMDPQKYLHSFPDKAQNDQILDAVRMRAGLPLNKAENKDAPIIKLGFVLREKPDQALALLTEIHAMELRSLLGRDQLGLLYGEAVRTHNQTAINKLQSLLYLSKADLKLYDQFVCGENVNLDAADIEPDLLASAFFIRSRNPGLSSQEKTNWRQRAAKTDVLQGGVTTAIKQWQS